MPHDIALPIWPSITNCLSWSADSELAVAADGCVELLLPKLKLFKLDLKHSKDNLWSTLHLRIDQFTQNEVGIQEALSSANFSVGEELSSCVVIALAWSPPGLAKHGRCTLAVLTNNLVLSIWAPGGDPTILNEWKRVLLINRALDGFSQSKGHFDGLDDDARLELAKKKQRIRAFAWGPSLTLGYEHKEHLDITEIGNHNFLAISNDCNEIILIRIKSHHLRTTTRNGTWEASISRFFSIDEFNFSDAPNLTFTFEEYISKTAYVNHIAWSPWSRGSATSKSGDSYCLSFIAYTTSSKLAIRVIRSFQSKLDVSVENEDTFVETIFQSPEIYQLQWLPTVSADYFELVATFSDQIRLYRLPVRNPKETQVKLLSRDEWDPVSGIAPCLSNDGTSILHYANFISTPSVETSKLAISFIGEKLQDSAASQWQKKIIKQQEDFSQAHNLDGFVCSKVWGIASSPLGSIIATISSRHPADLPEYVIPADHKSTLNVTNVLDENTFLLPNACGSTYRQNLTTETIAFGLLQWINANNAISWEDGTEHQHLVQSLEIGWASSEPADPDASLVFDTQPNDHSVFACIRYLRKKLYQSSLAKSRIGEQLISLVDPSIDRWTINDKATIRTLIATVMELPVNLDGGKVSKQVRALYETVNTRIFGVDDDLGAPSEYPEHCGICNSDVVLPFKDFRFASGICGHDFGKNSRVCLLSH